MKSRCPECGVPVSWFAGACSNCGAPNTTRRIVIGSAAALALLLVAGGAGLFIATRDQPLFGSLTSSNQASPGVDFFWLEDAMKACDSKAAQDPRTLHILVIPVSPSLGSTVVWSSLALNQIGNAFVLPGDRTLDGLKRSLLTITKGDYVFSIRDEATKETYRWDPANGVKWFNSTKAGVIKTLRMQIKPKDSGNTESWGNTVDHKPGTCYWINALPQ